tara:strand:+ start:1346 stop:2134 length:789 start_codon:yes stop_codon:yes gene_type:complete
MLPYINIPFGLTISSYNFFFLAGIYIGVIIFYLEVKRKKWDIENLMFSMSGCFVGSMIGAIFFNTILFGSNNTIEKIGDFNIEGMSVLGGIIGGFIGVEIFKKIVGHKESTGDAFAIAIPLGHATGRIGCFLSGCCFGKVCELPWATTYPIDSIPFLIHKNANLLSDYATTSLAIHPIPIYEIIFNIILFIILIKIRDYFKVNGALFRFYIFSYCLFRFFTEFLREDTGYPFFLGLKIIQINLIISIVLIVYWFYKNEFREA